MKSKHENHILKYSYFFGITTLQEISRTISYSFLALYIMNLNFSLDKYSFVKILSLSFIFLFEIPSGWLSDKFGRKKVWLLSIILFILSSSSFIISSHSSSFVYPAEIFYGIGFAFLTGTLKSSKINEIKNNDPNYLKSFFHDLKIFNLSSRLIGSSIGAALFYFTNFNPFIVSLSLFFIIFIIGLNYKDYQPEKNEFKPLKSVKIAFQDIRSKDIFILLSSLLISQLIVVPTYQYWQPIFKKSLPDHFKIIFMLAFVIFNISGIIGSYVGKKLIMNRYGIYFGFFIMTTPMIIMFFTGFNYSVIILFAITTLGRNIYDPKFRHAIQSKLIDKRRGFMTSLFSSLGSAVGSFVLFVMGITIGNGVSIKLLILLMVSIYILFNVPLIYFGIIKTNSNKNIKKQSTK